MVRNDQYKVMVAHPEQQHSYRTAAALKRAGLLDCYVTTVYYKDRSFTKLISSILPAKWKAKAKSRHCDEFDDNEVIQLCEKEGIVKLFTLNVPFARRWYSKSKLHVADRFARKAARVAIEREVDVVIAYDDTSPIFFELLKDKAPKIKRVMDMTAANTLFMRAIYEKDLAIKPDFAEKLKTEREIVWDPIRIDRTKREFAMAEYFICGSEFVQKSLTYSGINDDQCIVCPYGVNGNSFPFIERLTKKIGDPLEFIFVGGTKELKGIAYLLDAFLEIDRREARLTVVGENNLPKNLANRYRDSVTFTGMIHHDEVFAWLAKSDVMILPSLGEGLSLSILEALSSGLPVVYSENAGVAGILTDGSEGFEIPIQNQEAISDRVAWFVKNREAIPAMSKAARRTAEKYSWDRYSEQITEEMLKIIKG